MLYFPNFIVPMVSLLNFQLFRIFDLKAKSKKQHVKVEIVYMFSAFK